MKREMMEKAGTALVSAPLLLDAGDSDGAASRAYYAMFDAASAALAWAGATESSGRPRPMAG